MFVSFEKFDDVILKIRCYVTLYDLIMKGRGRVRGIPIDIANRQLHNNR
jgi:hypothetical protein